jgi:hypothetical protein
MGEREQPPTFDQSDQSVINQNNANTINITNTSSYTKRSLSRADAADEPTSPVGCLLLLLVIVVIVAGGKGGWLLFSRYRNLDVTFSGPIEGVTTKTVRKLGVTVDGDPPFQGLLELTPSVVRTGKLGDCVVPATLALTLLTDDTPGHSQAVRSGDRVSLEVPAGTHRMAIEIRYINKDGSECQVRVSLADGQLVR